MCQDKQTIIYDTLVFNCNCLVNPGIIIHNNKAFCRWCKKELIKGGSIVCNSKHFTEVEGEENKC